ncbi:MAG: family 65 glycosyl hydrolase, partial [Spirochaetaceae bacterium]|nr:family 65 glycosyl hydrolase [Spirochaetaceae bacterium]
MSHKVLKTHQYNPVNLALEETLFHTANGRIGVRANFEEGYDEGIVGIRGSYLNAFFDTHRIVHPEKLFGFPEIGEKILNVTDVQCIDVQIEGRKVTITPENVSEYSRAMDMGRGEASRSFTWTDGGKPLIKFDIRRLASFLRREVFALSYSVTAIEPVRFQLQSIVNGEVSNFFDPSDPRVAGEAYRTLIIDKSEIDGNRLTMESYTQQIGHRLFVQSDHRIITDTGRVEKPKSHMDSGVLALVWEAALTPGESITLEKISTFRDSRRFPDEDERCRDYWNGIDVPPYKVLAEEQVVYVEEFWEKAAVDIDGDDAAAANLNFNIYQLFQSTPSDNRAGIPAKGLSGEGYEGHYFWDTEIYMFPFLLYTRPEAARSILLFRHSTLPGAREQARILGHQRGAAYPWRTISGRECSAYYPSGSAQYHINADIAYAVIRYWEATEDDVFIRDFGAEILFETARIWLELGNFSDGRFHIHGVTGPDEYTCLVNDNYFTNQMARKNLQSAVDVYAWMDSHFPVELTRLSDTLKLDRAETQDWESAADRMYLPYDAVRNLNPQDESFLRKPMWDFSSTPPDNHPLLLHYHHMTLSRFQVCKQADTVLAYVLLNPPEKDSTIRKSFHYYEGVTTHDSSLSYAAFAILAARLGEPEKAYEYFSRTVSLDLNDTHGNTKDGIHAANMGGAWMAAVWGFGGFFPDGSLPTFRPVLPSKWKR